MGIESPDLIFKDFTNHYYNITPNESGYHSGKLLDKIQESHNLIISFFENPSNINSFFNKKSLVNELIDSHLKKFIFLVGFISHYIADLYQPLHTDGKYRFSYETIIHKIYEADVRKNFPKLEITLPKRRRIISDNKSFFENKIHEVHKNYNKIIDSYYLSSNKVLPDRWVGVYDLTGEMISQAIATISCIFFSYEKLMGNIFDLIEEETVKNKILGARKKNKKYSLRKYKSGSFLVKAK